MVHLQRVGDVGEIVKEILVCGESAQGRKVSQLSALTGLCKRI